MKKKEGRDGTMNSVVAERDFRNLPADPPIQADPNWLPVEIFGRVTCVTYLLQRHGMARNVWIRPAENS